MVESLSIYTLLDDGTSVSFPKSKEGEAVLQQAIINAYTFTAGRMGSVNVQATLMYHLCLDEYWTQKEYVEFRGEKYFILSTPTSSKSNTDLRYKHELNFVSERVMLDNTYFFDVVSPDAEDVDQFVSNSTKFTFFGDIKEFAIRMNYSLQYSNLDYSVVVDDGIGSEAKLMSFEDKYFSEVLQEVFNTYELPYYFVGKVIHIGFTSNAITHNFRYGYDKELLSITKTNANYKIVNRCTGIGSTENIPYYYPNETRKTEVGVEADPNNKNIKQADIIISDEKKFKEQVSVNEEIVYKHIEQANIQQQPGVLTLWCDSGYQYPYTLNSQVNLVKEANEGRWLSYFYASISTIQAGTYNFTLGEYWMFRSNTNPDVEKTKAVSANISGNRGKWQIQERGGSSIYFDLKDNTLTAELQAGKEYLIRIEFYYSTPPSNYYPGTYLYYKIGSASLSFELDTWMQKESPIPLSRIGITINKEPAIGDKFKQIKIENDYMITSPNLLPPIYRQTWGKERFYNAINNTYINPDTGEYYNFENEYFEGNPKEMIVSFDYIKPSIKGIKNAAGQFIGEILDVAFDTDDNDEISAETNEYEHPYFYIKLRKFDGEYGFNLFEQGIASGEMTISVTSGNCAACNFKIGVVESTSNSNVFYNPVQVDESGNIVSGNFNDKTNEKNIQPQQQNTITNEVWIAVEKDTDTFGIIMPSYNRNYKPKTGDSFVIVNINLPNEYIYAAENELKEAIIKYMAANNSEKFNFSINFKRIFFAEYPEILAQLDENARLLIEYDEKQYTLYVSNYTYKVSEKEILPEITVELSDTITIRKGSMQKSIDAVKQDIMSSIGSIDFLKMGLKYFIRKDVDDSANGHLVFRKGLYVTREDEDVAAIQEGDTNAIQEGDTNAIQEYTETVESPISTSMTLGELDNVNPIVDETSSEDVLLVKKAGSSIWTQEKKTTSSSDKVYHTTINFSELMNNEDREITINELTELNNIKSKAEEYYVITYNSLDDYYSSYNVGVLVFNYDIVDAKYYFNFTVNGGVITVEADTFNYTWKITRRYIPNSYVPEAPKNDNIYGRKNGSWVAIQSGGSSGSITVDDHLDLESINPVQNKIITMNINELMDEVFKLSFRSFSGGGTYEKGKSITPSITWSLSRKGEEVNPTFASVNGSTANVSSNLKSWTSPTVITANTTYNVICRYESQEVSRSASYAFSFKKYWGTSADTTLNNSQILSLSNTWASKTMGKTTFDCTGGKYIYYIIPSSIYGNGVEFWVNGFKNTDTIVTDITVTNNYNVSEPYKMIRLNNIQTGILEVEFK